MPDLLMLMRLGVAYNDSNGMKGYLLKLPRNPTAIYHNLG